MPHAALRTSDPAPWPADSRMHPTRHALGAVVTGLVARAIASLLALGLLVVLPGSASAALDEPAAVNVSVTPTEFWPAPEDGGDTLTVTFTAPVDGSYEIQLHGTEDGLFYDFGVVAAGTYTWSWDGRDKRGNLFNEQNMSLEIWSWRDRDHWADEIRVPIALRRSTDSDYIVDNTGEVGSKHVDLDKFTLTTDHRGLHARYDFMPDYRKATLFSAQAYLDVDRLKRGYIATIRRHGGSPTGKFDLTLQLATLYSDAPPQQLRCRGMKAVHEKRAFTLTVPRKCLRRGGDSVRAGAFVSDVHSHYDGFPDYGDDYRWTDWVRYAPRS